MVGIYKITSPNNRIYIGQSIDIKKRFANYNERYAKKQIRLASSFIKYGTKNHIFEVIEECNIEELNTRERYWQDFYNVLGKNGLNCILQSTDSKRVVYSEELLIKKSERWSGILHPSYGKKYSDEEKKILSDKNKDYWQNNKFHLKGITLTDEHKNKLKGRGGLLNPKSKLVLDLNTGIFYYSLSEYCKLYNIKYDNIKQQLNGCRTNKTSLIYC